MAGKAEEQAVLLRFLEGATALQQSISPHSVSP